MRDGFLGHVRSDEWLRRFALWTGTRSDAFAVSGMVALFALLHGIWFIRVPGDLDAFNFVLGVRDFDVAQHRPHPPGAPVYIAGGKAATWLWEWLGLPADRGTTVEIKLSGDVPRTRRARSAQIQVVGAGQVLDTFSAAPAFSRQIAIPSAAASHAADVDIIIGSTFSFVPHDQWQSADRRELAFRVFDLNVRAMTPPK